ncbi:BadF/BadG/BcrA/BcrD ATPase family protein, partial [Gemmatimonadota bacterium]
MKIPDPPPSIRAALDIGSRNIKAVVLDQDHQLVDSRCHPLNDRLTDCLIQVVSDLSAVFREGGCSLSAVTGAQAGRYAESLGVPEADEIASACRGTTWKVPQAGTILAIGGEHSKLIRLSPSPGSNGRMLKDFSLNSVCSAGSGSFLEQEAHRFDLSIEEFGALALESQHPVPVAGRCAVFAKTDVVHKHQSGVPLSDITYSLCLAIARNINAELLSGREYDLPLVLIGGVAANPGIQRALRESLGLDRDMLLVPDQHLYLEAVGAILHAEGENRSAGCPLNKVE